MYVLRNQESEIPIGTMRRNGATIPRKLVAGHESRTEAFLLAAPFPMIHVTPPPLLTVFLIYTSPRPEFPDETSETADHAYEMILGTPCSICRGIANVIDLDMI